MSDNVLYFGFMQHIWLCVTLTVVMPVMFVCVFNAFPGSTRLVGNVCSFVVLSNITAITVGQTCNGLVVLIWCLMSIYFC